MAPGFATPSAAGGDAQGPPDAEMDAALLAYVSGLLPDSAEAPGVASPPLPEASNSSNDSGSGGRAASGDDAKLVRQRVLAAKRRRAYRERSGAELQSLRQQAAALSEQLEALTNHRALQANATAELIPSCTAVIPASAGSEQTADVWRELAFRQREGRLAAERLRRRLKTQVATRQAFLRDIASSLSHRTAIAGSPAPTTSVCAFDTLDQRLAVADNETGKLVVGLGEGSTAADLSRIDLADASLFETYLDELDAAYAKTDEVLQESGFAGQPDETRHQRIARKEDGGEDDGYEIVDSLVVPFRFDAIRRIMWDAVVRVHGRADRQSYPSVRDPSNTVAVKFALQCRPRDGDHESASGVPLVILLVLRRYVESAREVLVWRAFSEGMGAVEGLSSDETGWSIARAAAMPPDSPFGSDATINQTVVRFQMIRVHPSGGPSDAGSTAAPAPDEDLFAKLIASSADEDGEQISRLMERLMLSEADDAERVQDG